MKDQRTFVHKKNVIAYNLTNIVD